LKARLVVVGIGVFGGRRILRRLILVGHGCFVWVSEDGGFGEVFQKQRKPRSEMARGLDRWLVSNASDAASSSAPKRRPSAFEVASFVQAIVTSRTDG